MVRPTLTEQLWAILPEKLSAITEFVQRSASGAQFTDDEIRELVGKNYAARRAPGGAGSAIAVLPLHGVISHRENIFAEMGFGTSTEGFTKTLRGAVNDPKVTSIVLDVDSPGGGVTGVEELHMEILRAAAQKRVVAVANGLMASAAYWLASAASEIVAIPSAQVGSIGVFAVHGEVSKMLEKQGVGITVIKSGARKGEGNMFEPLSAETREFFQDRVDKVHGIFIRDVAAGRRTPQANVRENYGQGRAFYAREALDRGVIDRIGTLDNAVAVLAGRKDWSSMRSGAVSLTAGDKEYLEIRRRRLEWLTKGA